MIVIIVFFFCLFPVNTVGCIYTNGGSFSLQCGNSQRIHVVDASVGWSPQWCRNSNRCCPSENGKSDSESNGVKSLQDRCDGQQRCDLVVVEWDGIDYESINYICRIHNNNPVGKLTLGFLSDRFILQYIYNYKQYFSIVGFAYCIKSSRIKSRFMDLRLFQNLF